MANRQNISLKRDRCLLQLNLYTNYGVFHSYELNKLSQNIEQLLII